MPAAHFPPRLTAPKLAKSSVNYRGRVSADFRCGRCRYFAPPADCLLVEGQITAQGICDHACIDQQELTVALSVDPVESHRERPPLKRRSYGSGWFRVF